MMPKVEAILTLNTALISQQALLLISSNRSFSARRWNQESQLVEQLLTERTAMLADIAKMKQEEKEKDSADRLKQFINGLKKTMEESRELGNQQQTLYKLCEQFAGIESSMAQIRQLDNFVGVLKDRFGNDLLKAVHPDFCANIAELFSNPCQNCWDAIACHGGLEILDSKCAMVHYRGDGDGWRSVLAKCPPLSNGPTGLFYFEVRAQNVKSSMAIGLATKAMPLEGQMVGDYSDTFGYSNDGILHTDGTHLHYENANFSRGDTVGCGINLATRRVIFTKNGQPLDTSDLFVNSPIDSLFPCLSLENSGDLANANFGPDFKFSLVQVKVPIKLQQNSWDANACQNGLAITGPKSLIVHYKGNGNFFSLSAFAKHPIPDSDFGIFYFEIEVKNTSGHEGFGFATKAMPMDDNRWVGNHSDSYGYHGDGEIWINGSKKREGNPTYSAGDVVGCGVDLTNRQIIFTKNGQRLDTTDLFIFSSTTGPFFPCITLGNSGDKIEANFGPNFEYDLGTLPKK